MEFFANTSKLERTPYRPSTRGVLTEPLTKPFEYADNVMAVLKARGYQPKGTGVTLDGPTARQDFLALRSAMTTVLDPVDSNETAKIFDLDLAYRAYHFDLNTIVFTMLSVLLRGAALDLYHSAARAYPFDGRAVLLRLHYDIEGVQRGDPGRYMESMRALRIDERTDPNDILHQLRTLADEHKRLHPQFDDPALVATLLVVLEKSADTSPYEVPLYQHVITELYTTTTTTFDTVVLRIRRTWQREGIGRLARFPPPPASSSGGDAGSATAPGGARHNAFRSRTVLPPEGKWEDTGGPYKAWNGTGGRPCLICYRLYGLTDAHPDTDGLCLLACVDAFSTGRAPKSAKPPPTRPEPPTAPAMTSFRTEFPIDDEKTETFELLPLELAINPADPGEDPIPPTFAFAGRDDEEGYPAFVDAPDFPSERRGPVFGDWIN